MVSSRTNAIAFDIFGLIQAELRRTGVICPVYWIDRLRSSRWLRGALWAGAVVLILCSVWIWVKQGADLSDLAANFIAPAVLAILALWSKKR